MRWRNPFLVDTRALAFLRIAVACIIIADLLIRWGDVDWFLSNQGVYSAGDAKALSSEWRFSLYWLVDSTWWVHLLFACNLVVAIILMSGMRTRVATVLALIFLVSLQNRNPVLLQGGDNLLLLLVFWGLFLPWGERLSVDAAMTKRPMATNQYFGVGGVALFIQVLSVYFFSAFLKNGTEWTVDGSAIYYALHNDQVAHLLAPYWRDWHAVTVPLTHYVWWLELLGPIIALSPWFNHWARGLAAFCFITLEIGFLFNLNVGLFPFISMASLLVLVPSPAWDRAAQLCKAKHHAPMTMYFDKDCVFCEKTCVLIRAIFGLNARIVPAQNYPEVGALLEREFSWVLEVDGQRYLRWGALIEVVRRGGRFQRFHYLLKAPGRFGDVIYAWIGHNRVYFGKVTAVLMPWRDQLGRPGIALQLVAFVFAVVVLAGNVSRLPTDQRAALPGVVVGAADIVRNSSVPAVDLFRLDQYWNMFAPYPQKNDGWFLMVGLTTDGELVDVLNWRLTEPSTAKPQNFIPEQAKNYRWRKYLTRIKRSGYKNELGRFASANCKRWNDQALLSPVQVDQVSEHSWPTLEAFNIYYIKERTPVIGEQGSIEYELLWKHHCLDASRLGEDAVQKAMLATAETTRS
jgi:predicted DCC family thiol-disulfide oxidoreductase YuxK